MRQQLTDPALGLSRQAGEAAHPCRDGLAHGHCQSNPVDVVGLLLAQQPGKAIRTKHQPSVPWKDIPAFATTHLKPRDRYDVGRAMLEFLILTACRSGEARGMVWPEVDLENAVWTVWPERMKAKLPRRTRTASPPLSPRRQRAPEALPNPPVSSSRIHFVEDLERRFSMTIPDFFRARLDAMIEQRHPLVVLATHMSRVGIE